MSVALPQSEQSNEGSSQSSLSHTHTHTAVLWQHSDCRVEVAEASRRTTFTSLPACVTAEDPGRFQRIILQEVKTDKATSHNSTSTAVCLLCLHMPVCVFACACTVCLLHPEDLSRMSFPAAPYCPSITLYSQPSVNMWVNALNLPAYLSVCSALKGSPVEETSLLVSAQPLMYRAQVVLLLRGLISWFFAPSPFSDSGSPSGQD